MTTSHRPQLEARSGAKAAAYTPTATEHARLLPGHKTIKYRVGRKKTDSESLQERDISVKYKKTEDEGEQDRESVIDEGDDDHEHNNVIGEDESENNNSLTTDETSEITKMNEVAHVLQVEHSDVKKVKKKNWRNNTTFSRRRKHEEAGKDGSIISDYVNNMTSSEHHEKFLKKFVR